MHGIAMQTKSIITSFIRRKYARPPAIRGPSHSKPFKWKSRKCSFNILYCWRIIEENAAIAWLYERADDGRRLLPDDYSDVDDAVDDTVNQMSERRIIASRRV